MSLFEVTPFRTRHRPDGRVLVVSSVGDAAVLDQDELRRLADCPESLPLERQAELQAKFFLVRPGSTGVRRLLRSRQTTKRVTVSQGPTLHIIVPTLQCGHSCGYCQVSRAMDSAGASMSRQQIEQACATILESPSNHVTVEFQGGDPLLRFDLIELAMERLAGEAPRLGKKLTFVVASTLHQLNGSMCDVLEKYRAHLSTSIDGPSDLHDRNRPTPGRNSHARTVAGIQLARARLGHRSVAALATVTRAALGRAEDLVDEYVRLDLEEINLRPVSPYGFASPGRRAFGLTEAEYQEFYRCAFARVIEWNKKGYDLREGQAAIVLNKLLSSIDAGYVDLQPEAAGGRAVLVYNYDGFVYPSDEARMLAETGNTMLRLGPIGRSLKELSEAPPLKLMASVGSSEANEECRRCAFGAFCGPDPTEALVRHGTVDVLPSETTHCHRTQWLFDFMIDEWLTADSWKKRLLLRWAQPRGEI